LHFLFASVAIVVVVLLVGRKEGEMAAEPAKSGNGGEDDETTESGGAIATAALLFSFDKVVSLVLVLVLLLATRDGSNDNDVDGDTIAAGRIGEEGVAVPPLFEGTTRAVFAFVFIGTVLVVLAAKSPQHESPIFQLPLLPSLLLVV